jgi:hypothetical protein
VDVGEVVTAAVHGDLTLPVVERARDVHLSWSSPGLSQCLHINIHVRRRPKDKVQ